MRGHTDMKIYFQIANLYSPDFTFSKLTRAPSVMLEILLPACDSLLCGMKNKGISAFLPLSKPYMRFSLAQNIY